MAVYQPVHVKIWSDPWFAEMRPQGKLLFLYLLTSPANTPSGMFRCRPREMAFDTGLPVKQVVSALGELSGHVAYDPNKALVWVVNATKYWPMSPNVAKAIRLQIRDIGPHPFVDEYWTRYAGIIDAQEATEHLNGRATKPLANPSEGVSEPLSNPNPLPTPGKPLANTRVEEPEESIQSIQSNQSEGVNGIEGSGEKGALPLSNPGTDPPSAEELAEAEAAYWNNVAHRKKAAGARGRR